MRRLFACLLVLAALTLVGCGNKGPLVHPDATPAAPASS